MSQQSLTNLSQAANCLHKPPKPDGGASQFKAGIAGPGILKTDTLRHVEGLKQKQHDKEMAYERDRPMRLIEYHYQTSKARQQERERLGCLDLPPKPVAAIPGYSGWLPRLEAANVIGCTFKTGCYQAADLFSYEQEIVARTNQNILPPSKTLSTPDTGV